MTARNPRIVLQRRPHGLVTWDDVSLEVADLPELAEGEALLRQELLGMDATVRSWLNDAAGYLPPVELGEVIRCAGAGRVVASRCPAYAEGDVCATLGGMQHYAVVRDDAFTTKLAPGSDMAAQLAVYASTGPTAYIGTVEVGQAAAGETFVVSAAAGATGSLAGQIAKRIGCRVVGIAGSDDKCRFVVEELGFDGCVNHRDDDVAARLHEVCPKGVDVYFDNVGGSLLDVVLGQLAAHGRVVLCGAIAVYNEDHKPPGPANYLNLISRRGRMEGFIALDSVGRFPEIAVTLAEWIADGTLRYTLHELEGLESCVDALNALFTGANTGKVVVRLDVSPRT